MLSVGRTKLNFRALAVGGGAKTGICPPGLKKLKKRGVYQNLY
jgi:hypothetical protein